MEYVIPVSWYWKKDFLSGRSHDKLEQEIKDSDFLVADAKGTRRMIGLKWVCENHCYMAMTTCIFMSYEMSIAKSIALGFGKRILCDEEASVLLFKKKRGEKIRDLGDINIGFDVLDFLFKPYKKPFNPLSVDDAIYLYGHRLRNFFTVKDLVDAIGSPDFIKQNSDGKFQTYIWYKIDLCVYSCKRTSGKIFKIVLLDFEREQIGDVLLNSIKEDDYVQDENVVFKGKIEKSKWCNGMNFTIELYDARFVNSKLLYEHDNSRLNKLIKKSTVMFRDKFYKGTMLHYAAGNDNIELLKALIKNGADVNAKDAFGDTAYDIAVNQNQRSAANFLRKLAKKKCKKFLSLYQDMIDIIC